MLFDIIRNGFTVQTVMNILARVFVVFCTLPLHEYAHALMAVKLGDDTPRLKGRLTISPFAHLDLIGSLMIFLVGFGYAKPVPVNIRNFKKRKLYMALTAFAGPFANIILAFIFIVLMLTLTFADSTSIIVNVAYYFLYFAAYVNVSLAVFNLIPIPPLDGSRIFSIIIPDKYYYAVMKYERYIMLAVFVLIFAGVLDVPLSWLTSNIFEGLYKLAVIPFNLLR